MKVISDLGLWNSNGENDMVFLIFNDAVIRERLRPEKSSCALPLGIQSLEKSECFLPARF